MGLREAGAAPAGFRRGAVRRARARRGDGARGGGGEVAQAVGAVHHDSVASRQAFGDGDALAILQALWRATGHAGSGDVIAVKDAA
jgi:hypothetical protein